MELEQEFVTSFPSGSSRHRLFRGYLAHRAGLAALIPILSQWVDGSFVSAAESPADIDVVTFMDGTVYDGLPLGVRHVIASLVPGRQTVPAFGCDSYGIFVYPAEHRDFARYASARLYWTSQWAKDRSGTPKGFIEVPS